MKPVVKFDAPPILCTVPSFSMSPLYTHAFVSLSSSRLKVVSQSSEMDSSILIAAKSLLFDLKTQSPIRLIGVSEENASPSSKGITCSHVKAYFASGSSFFVTKPPRVPRLHSSIFSFLEVVRIVSPCLIVNFFTRNSPVATSRVYSLKKTSFIFCISS